jgi:Xaa-Pro dipeptidase
MPIVRRERALLRRGPFSRPINTDAEGSVLASTTQEIIGMPLPFDDAEYQRRIDRTRRALHDAELDAVLLFHQESMYYLFGYDQLGYWVYQTAILRADYDKVKVVCREADYNFIHGLHFVEEMRNWRDDSADDPAKVTTDVLRESGLLGSSKRIGIELKSHALLPAYYESLRTGLAGQCELVDASDLITELRLRKSPTEIEYMRHAALVMDAGFEAAFKAMRPGVAETEVLAQSMAASFAAGGDTPAILPPTASGPRTLSQTHGAATSRKIKNNEPFVFEIGGCYRRYHAVGVNSKWIGDVPSNIAAAYDVLTQGLDVGLQGLKPGESTSELATKVNTFLDGHGMYSPGRHIGYGTGIGYPPTWLDNLRIKRTDTHVLESGMTFFYMLHRTVDTSSGPVDLFVGEPILITDHGHERLKGHTFSLEIPR